MRSWIAFRAETQIMRAGRVEGRIFTNLGLARLRGRHRPAPSRHRIRKLKRAILHQLSVKPAVRAEVDVLKENSPHGGIDPRAGLVGVNGERRDVGGEQTCYRSDES